MSLVTLNNRALKDATAVGTTTGLGDLVFISRSTASSSSSVSITSGIDSTYKEYIFVFNNIHPATDNSHFQFNLSVDGGSNYNVTKTSSVFNTYHQEADSFTQLAYSTEYDLAQSTNYQTIQPLVGNGNDECVSGYLHLFEPSSTTFVKHFIGIGCTNGYNDYLFNHNPAGYGNTTSAVNAIDFKMSSGNIDSGTIDLYGVN